MSLSGARGAFRDALGREPLQVRGIDAAEHIFDGAVTVAAITSCTNTSNPSVMIAAGLVARRAVERGLVVDDQQAIAEETFVHLARLLDRYYQLLRVIYFKIYSKSPETNRWRLFYF